MLAIRRALMAIGLLLIMVNLGQLSSGRAAEHSMLRLSWRTNGEQIKVAIKQDAQLPAHMRLPEGESYESSVRPYRLQMQLDGTEVLDRRILSAGFRHDRPLSVFEEFSVRPGEHQLVVAFTPETVEGAPPPRETTPYQQKLEFTAGQVKLLTLDVDGAWLIKETAPPATY